MSVPRPPAPPPRRSVPPPPSRRDAETEEVVEPRGIAARIASLQLNQVGRSPESKPPVARPKVPVEVTTVASLRPRRPTWEEIEARGPEYVEALKRPPPSIPSIKDTSLPPPPPPARRLPPKPARLPTPPPEPEPEPEVLEPEEYYDEPQSESCLKCHDFSFVDEHAAQFPRETVSSMDQLAYDLTAPWESETEKFRAIFSWLHENITYDVKGFFSGNIPPQNAESTLQSGMAVCDGYAGLCLELATKAGLQAMKVTGHGKGFGYVATGPDTPLPAYAGNHAWNCVLMDGEWRLIDCCWGAGALDGNEYKKRFDTTWFTSTPREFGTRHYPEDPGYQLIADEDGGPVSWADYILEPEGPVLFSSLEELSLSRHFLQPDTKYLQRGTWVSFHIFKQCEHMSTDESDNYVSFIATPDDQKVPMTLNSEGGWSAQVYIPRDSGGEVSLYYVTQIDNRDAKGVGVKGWQNAVGRKTMAFGGLARWTIA